MGPSTARVLEVQVLHDLSSGTVGIFQRIWVCHNSSCGTFGRISSSRSSCVPQLELRNSKNFQRMPQLELRGIRKDIWSLLYHDLSSGTVGIFHRIWVCHNSSCGTFGRISSSGSSCVPQLEFRNSKEFSENIGVVPQLELRDIRKKLIIIVA